MAVSCLFGMRPTRRHSIVLSIDELPTYKEGVLGRHEADAAVEVFLDY